MIEEDFGLALLIRSGPLFTNLEFNRVPRVQDRWGAERVWLSWIRCPRAPHSNWICPLLPLPPTHETQGPHLHGEVGLS